jgi:hypothetical protein
MGCIARQSFSERNTDGRQDKRKVNHSHHSHYLNVLDAQIATQVSLQRMHP